MTTVIHHIPETGTATHNTNPYNNGVPSTSLINAEPKILGPIGVVPHYKTPSEYWPWDYGNGGGY